MMLNNHLILSALLGCCLVCDYSPFVDSLDQDEPAENVQSDPRSTLSDTKRLYFKR